MGCPKNAGRCPKKCKLVSASIVRPVRLMLTNFHVGDRVEDKKTRAAPVVKFFGHGCPNVEAG